MKNTVRILCPSRGRPERAAAMWGSAMDTASGKNDVVLALYLDEDDPKLGAYEELSGNAEKQAVLMKAIGKRSSTVPTI